ncbi:hypothetical protein MUN82_21050 [Hymenobacter aerilatus]|uniref:Inverse autotransporter beta-domain domain-containing protein n=1 Tax=Hymenobacter aerilatus TaxID=2932251 RepID=A0A8T9SVI8_9BACT|nr:hypothetical protein [Hymenobacter aerilatus]UOR05401.1 hypothetical protein MUN82_21050 [Hymenobacter aerilatus]
MKIATCFVGLLVALLATATVAIAQRRTVNDVALLPQLQAEYALHGDDYLLLNLRGLISPGRTGNGLERTGLQVGYERFWNTQWSGGATVGFKVSEDNRFSTDLNTFSPNLAPELFVRHWNTIGGFNFRQRLGVAYAVYSTQMVDNRAFTSLRLDVDRPVPVGEKVTLLPRLAYEATAYLRFQRDEATQPKERVIDFGYARAEVGVRFSNRFDITPWFGYQTEYIFALPQTDGTGKVTIPGGRLNKVTPVAGLDARFTLFRGGSVFERRQLPTQH